MTCPAYGHEELQDRKTVLAMRPLTLHLQCPNGHAWHMPLVIKPSTEPMPRDCEAEA